METQRNADDGISAESVNEKAKQGGQGKEKLSSCFCLRRRHPESQDPYGRFSSLMPTR